MTSIYFFIGGVNRRNYVEGFLFLESKNLSLFSSHNLALIYILNGSDLLIKWDIQIMHLFSYHVQAFGNKGFLFLTKIAIDNRHICLLVPVNQRRMVTAKLSGRFHVCSPVDSYIYQRSEEESWVVVEDTGHRV